MRILHFADLHLDAGFSALGPVAGRLRRRAIRDTLKAIAGVAKDENVDAIFCAGDLFEQERIVPDTVHFLHDVFRGLDPIPIYIAPGNHDWYGAASAYRRQPLPENVHVFEEDTLQPVDLDEGLTLWGASFRQPHKAQGDLDSFRVDRDGVHLALFHGSENGSFRFEAGTKKRYAPFQRDQIAGAGFRHAFVGHHHVPADDDLFTYPGNPEPLTFGEEGPRGVVIASIENNGITTRRITVARTRVHELVLDVTGCTNADCLRERFLDVLGSLKGFARVTVRGELQTDVDLTRADLAGIRGSLDAPPVIVHGEVHRAYDFAALREENTVRGVFVRQVFEADLDRDETRRVATMGLRAFDERTDLEVE
ncbi:MAG: metallophosphoesterase family protein [Longimicrobiales bacterium]